MSSIAMGNMMDGMCEDRAAFYSSLNVPHIGQFFGPWSVYAERFQGIVDHVNTLNLHAHVSEQKQIVQDSQPLESATAYQIVRDKIAVIELSGLLAKRSTSLTQSTSTIAVRQQLRHAVQSELIESILLVFDSPGGTASGTPELADAIAAASKQKRVEGWIDELCASAAYFAASQCHRLHCNKYGWTGGIGTYSTLVDSSKNAEQAGFKVRVIREGDFKGMGTPGTEITEQHVSEVHRIIKEVNEHFLQATMRGRKMSRDQLLPIADGRIHGATDAIKLGLIDSIASFSDVIDQLANEGEQPQQGRQTVSTETQTEPKAATLEELKTACPKASSDFLLSQLEHKATTQQASQAFAEDMANQLAEQQKKNEELAKELEQKKDAETQTNGVAGVSTGDSNGKQSSQASGGDAIEEFNQAVQELMDKGMTRTKAIKSIHAKDPELHEAFLCAQNPGKEQFFQNRYR